MRVAAVLSIALERTSQVEDLVNSVRLQRITWARDSQRSDEPSAWRPTHPLPHGRAADAEWPATSAA